MYIEMYTEGSMIRSYKHDGFWFSTVGSYCFAERPVREQQVWG